MDLSTMDLRWWWIAAILALVTIAVIAVQLLRPIRPRAGGEADLRAAHTDRVHQIPAYRRLACQHLRRLGVQLVCLVIALGGAGLVAARLSNAEPPQLKNRDIMLCLDVSGSMKKVDALVVDSYLQLVDRLDNERIGFVIWDSSAVTVFPLTSDTAFIREQLRIARDQLASENNDFVLGTREAGDGSSMVGDGLVSCTQRFDNTDKARPRAVVLATDNIVNGKPIFTLDQAIAEDVRNQVMVFAIAPDIDKEVELSALRNQVRRTGGDLLKVRPGETSDVSAISAAVEEKQRALLENDPTRYLVDEPWPGVIALCLGLVAASWFGVLLERRRR